MQGRNFKAAHNTLLLTLFYDLLIPERTAQPLLTRKFKIKRSSEHYLQNVWRGEEEGRQQADFLMLYLYQSSACPFSHTNSRSLSVCLSNVLNTAHEWKQTLWFSMHLSLYTNLGWIQLGVWGLWSQPLHHQALLEEYQQEGKEHVRVFSKLCLLPVLYGAWEFSLGEYD